MKILIIELFNTGHHPEFIKHFLEGLSKGKETISDEYIFLLSQNLKNNFLEYNETEYQFNIIYLNDLEQRQFESNKYGRKLAAFLWKLIENKQKELLFEHVFFMNLNQLLRSQKTFNLFYKCNCTFSGIFFQSPFILRSLGLTKILICKKREMMLRLLARNTSCTSIYLLNDLAGSMHYKKWSNKFKFIPDPINMTTSSDLNVSQHHGILGEHFIFLHIGSLGHNKGTFELLDAIAKLPREVAVRMRFLLVGKMNSKLIEYIYKVNLIIDEPVIIFRNEYVIEKDFAAYLEQSHVVVIVNKNIETSSGIVNHCLYRKKIMISPGFGYFKKKLDNYKGVAFFRDVSSLTTCLIQVFNNYSKFEMAANMFDNSEFIYLNSPEEFFKRCIQNDMEANYT